MYTYRGTYPILNNSAHPAGVNGVVGASADICIGWSKHIQTGKDIDQDQKRVREHIGDSEGQGKASCRCCCL